MLHYKFEVMIILVFIKITSSISSFRSLHAYTPTRHKKINERTTQDLVRHGRQCRHRTRKSNINVIAVIVRYLYRTHIGEKKKVTGAPAQNRRLTRPLASRE